jgi:hypothetical protein
MVDSTKSALQLLQELRNERDDLDRLIRGLEARVGISSSHQVSESDNEPEASRAVPTAISLPIGFFHNLSQAAAAEKLLAMNPGQALTTGEILEAFRNSKMTVNPKNALTILYTALKRSPKFERVGSKAWGLKEWYPEKKKRASREETPSDSDEA